MRKILSMLLMGILGLLLIVFLVANMQPVMISLDPFSTDDPAFALGPLPLWVALAISMFLGFFMGALGMWSSGKNVRRKASTQKKELKELKKQAASAPVEPNSDANLPAVQS